MSEPSTPAGVLELTVELKRKTPGRTVAQVTAIIAAVDESASRERTIQRLFAGHGLNTRSDGTPPAALGRFEAAGAMTVGPATRCMRSLAVARPACSRSSMTTRRRPPATVGGCSGDTVRLEAALRKGLASRKIPRSAYVDNGPTFIEVPLLGACAMLEIRLILECQDVSGQVGDAISGIRFFFDASNEVR